MIITLPPVSAMAMVATKWCAATGSEAVSRPILGGIFLEWDTTVPHITATATESHVLAHREIRSAEFGLEEGEDPVGSLLVKATDLYAAVKDACGPKMDQKVYLVLEGTKPSGHGTYAVDGQVTVTNMSTWTLTLPGIDGTFPKYRSLGDLDGRLFLDEAREVTGVGLNPEMFTRLAKAGWTKRTERDGGDKSLVIRPNGTGKDPALAPWIVGYDEAPVGPFRGLIMPVRMEAA